MQRLSVAAVLGGLICVGSVALAQEQRKPPKNPDKPFTVYLFTDGLTNEDVDMPRVTEEVSKRVAKNKKWFKVVDEREGADFVIEMLTHAVQEQHRRELDMRVDLQGTGKNYYDNNWITERHHIESRVTLPSGAQKMFTGADDREKGGSLKGAATNLANQLETYCKENYWSLIGT